MSTRGYGSYRGRSALRRFLTALGIALAILLLVGTAAGLYLQQFLVISDDGVHLELPFVQQETPAPTPVIPSVDAPIDVSPSSTPTPTPTPTPKAPALNPILLPPETLHDGTALSLVDSAGADCALFDMKHDDGMLEFLSQHTFAVEGGLNTDDSIRNEAILSLNQTEDLYTVARVSCFKDHGLIQYGYDLAIHTNSGYRWTDPEGIRWSSPANPEVQNYLTDLCVELARLGFDEILLDYAGYPNEGNLHYIKKGDAYNADQFSAVIDRFYAQVAQALSDFDVVLSVVTSPSALEGTDVLTGQTPENLAHMDRLWQQNDAGILVPLESLSISP